MSLELIGWIVVALIAGGALAHLQRRLRESSSAEHPLPEAMPPPSRLTSEVFQDCLKEMISSGDRIQAIKLYREHHGVGLKEAKDAVEAIIDGRLPVAPPPSRPSPGTGKAEAEIEQALRDDNLIQAIKLYRGRYGVGLKEAKDACEDWRRRLRQEG